MNGDACHVASGFEDTKAITGPVLRDPGILQTILMGPTERFYVDPVIRPSLSIEHVVLTVATVFLTSVLAGLYPAWRAARLEPVEAIRRV